MDVEYYITNCSLLLSWALSIWIYFKYKNRGGIILFFAFLTDQIYSLIILHSSQIAFNETGMIAPAWIQIFRMLAIFGHLALPIGILVLIREKKLKKSEPGRAGETRSV